MLVNGSTAIDGLSGSARGVRLGQAVLLTLAELADAHPPSSHRFGDILQGLRTHILKGYIDLAANLPVSIVGNANTTRLCDPFEARCNIDAVTKDIDRLR